jgi:SAM-dependent methyltransferase
MLREHLSQAHDGASRRADAIDAHVHWIHNTVLEQRQSRILDLGCGPGLYCERLADFGHECTGIDIAPAAIAYAMDRAPRAKRLLRYSLGDVMTAPIDPQFDLVMMLHGEFNTFSRDDGRALLRRVRGALSPGGRVLLEVHRFESVRAMGSRRRQWMAIDAGLFGDAPHLRLDESRWDEGTRCALNLNWIIDRRSLEVTRYGTATQAYDDREYSELLVDVGFTDGRSYPSLTGSGEDQNYIVVLGTRAA